MVKFVLLLDKLTKFGVCTVRNKEDEWKGMGECLPLMYWEDVGDIRGTWW